MSRRRSPKSMTPREQVLHALTTALDDVREYFELNPDGGPWWHEALEIALADVRKRVEDAVAVALPSARDA